MSETDRLTELEMQLAHVLRQSDELSDVVAEQAGRIEMLERRVVALMQRAAEQETAGAGSVVLGDQPPPHW